MEYYFFASLSVIGLLSLSPLVQANPTQGYCQTVDDSVCGWGIAVVISHNIGMLVLLTTRRMAYFRSIQPHRVNWLCAQQQKSANK